ncbi:YjbQ family protein [Mariprofundus erugo]|uniref:YjbQ family protein n=1 Tax=Mariprofundus erugo TaxID=2528639 RepID=A0A5R9GRQ9_9PROT|nr:secondary thiamine-phosphate synthase enzyme YjbQ [Mariprofundus erugo]TLS65934.1 YjbQ family protein [Mariprofundus erugo]TLS76409.1 YjbQ family protein [Mariprofundus erugo]
MWIQKQLTLKPRSRGFHLITAEILSHLPELRQMHIGMAHLFIQHTSASLTINENADPSVRSDMEQHFNQQAPEHQPFYTHTDEGPDDMTAHLKATTIGNALMIPIRNGQLALGTWQGIYLGEHRNHGGSRKLIVTLQGE